jgi:hypothetical protein
MTTEPQRLGTSAIPQGTSARNDPPVGSDVEERADLEEDRRRQRELDDGELGGEA